MSGQIEKLQKQICISVEDEAVEFLKHNFVPSEKAKYSSLKVVRNDNTATVSISAEWSGIEAQVSCNDDWKTIAHSPDFLLELEVAFNLHGRERLFIDDEGQA